MSQLFCILVRQVSEAFKIHGHSSCLRSRHRTPCHAAHLSYFPPRNPFNACRCFTSASFLCFSISATSLRCHMHELFVLPDDSLLGACPGCHAARTPNSFQSSISTSSAASSGSGLKGKAILILSTNFCGAQSCGQVLWTDLSTSLARAGLTSLHRLKSSMAAS